MSPTAEAVIEMIRQGIPDADVQVNVYSGDDHFEVQVVAASFAGKSRIKQHQMVYAALGEQMKQAIHALALKTSIPKESI
ncbi:MAG: BolA family protein [Mariprofundus sp.]|nr:BolA family protein [Mariprofundus sp.]